MRFIIHEQPYETLLAAGLLRYEQDGKTTGAVEHWRLTSAVSGYRFLRVDLDAREAESGDSYLYHLVMTENGRPERLQYRFYGRPLEVNGTVLFEEEAVTAVRNVRRLEIGDWRLERIEDEVTVPAGYGFWFPSSVGLGLLPFTFHASRFTPAVSLRSVPSTQFPVFSLFVTEVKLEVSTPGQWHIQWEDQERTLWLNEQGDVLKMQRGDGLTAVETRYIRYS